MISAGENTICPHCAESLSGESTASTAGDPRMFHLPCLNPPAERVGDVVHLLHRMSLGELAEVDLHLHKIVQSTKWANKLMAEGHPFVDGVPLPRCRRCTECEGQNHHWIEGDGDAEIEFVCKHTESPCAHDAFNEIAFVCKHCGLTCPEKDPEAEHPEPDETRLHCACGLYPATRCGVGCAEYPDG